MARVWTNKISCFVMFVCLFSSVCPVVVMASLVRLFLGGLWGEQVKFCHVRLTSVSLL